LPDNRLTLDTSEGGVEMLQKALDYIVV
jgi:hypothetical protein